jgi:hypothetical protein
MAIYFAAASNFCVGISRNKRKVRKFAKNILHVTGRDLQLGCCNRQTFDDVESFEQQFGASVIYDLDQRIVFRSDFSVARTF